MRDERARPGRARDRGHVVEVVAIDPDAARGLPVTVTSTVSGVRAVPNTRYARRAVYSSRMLAPAPAVRYCPPTFQSPCNVTSFGGAVAGAT